MPIPPAAMVMVVLASAGAVVASGSSANEVVPSGVTAMAVPTWAGESVRDLHNEYYNIFRHGNRNAASHLWSTFLLERAPQMSARKLEYMFSGFCAVSGSPVTPGDWNRYRLNLDRVTGGKQIGYMHYCCWPCVCDTQDFIRVDSKTITTADGPRSFNFAVIGNPCDHEDRLHELFIQPFGNRHTTLAREAPEVRCDAGRLLGATMSDNGYVIINMFFAAEGSFASKQHQDESIFEQVCTSRAAQGYNSGMGEIFRKVAEISPVVIGQFLPAPSAPGTAAAR